MIYEKIFQLQKTFLIAKRFAATPMTLTLVGVYGTLPLFGGTTRVQAQSASSAASAAPVLSSDHNGIIEQSKSSLGRRQVALSQGGAVDTNGAPSGRQGGGSHNRPPSSPISPEWNSDWGAPADGNRVGGGSRGTCPAVTKKLTALVPMISGSAHKSQNPVLSLVPSGSVFGLTVSERPTFWFYFPYPLSSKLPVEFTLLDNNGKELYKTNLSESGTAPGVVGFSLPATAPALEVNKRYNWYFTIYCNKEEPIFVSGWIGRVPLDPALKEQLEQAKPQQKAALYANAGIWFDAATTLAQLRLQNPNDPTLQQDWVKLLQSINLEAIAQEPITSMLTPKR
jgi:hypothetical protein